MHRHNWTLKKLERCSPAENWLWYHLYIVLWPNIWKFPIVCSFKYLFLSKQLFLPSFNRLWLVAGVMLEAAFQIRDLVRDGKQEVWKLYIYEKKQKFLRTLHVLYLSFPSFALFLVWHFSLTSPWKQWREVTKSTFRRCAILLWNNSVSND